MKKILAFVFLGIIYLPLAGQAPAYDDLVFESDSITKAYKPLGKNFVFIRSKRGTGGVAKTSRADSILSLPITDIVLVFSELSTDAMAYREDANRERWENLLKTYPVFFQFETNYKNLCQCNTNGDTAAFKKAQGFYIYIKGKEEPKPAAAKVEKAADKDVADAGKSKNSKSNDEPKEEKRKKVKEEKPVKEEKVEKEAKTEKKEKPRKEEKVVKEEKVEKEEVTESAPAPKVKKAGFSKPKKAKDPKACRPPCYEGGDEDLHTFFKDNVKLSKKEKRHSDELVCKLRLQLNFDGTIKKSFITGVNETLNKQVEDAVKNMDTWNACVVNGTTVKSDVTLTLKYDVETQSIKPFETMITPRPGPKCKCASDTELFGSD
jgi:hypothetical protein